MEDQSNHFQFRLKMVRDDDDEDHEQVFLYVYERKSPYEFKVHMTNLKDVFGEYKLHKL